MGVYADAEDVAQFLQTENEFSSTTFPSADTVERLIEGVENEIDNATKHAWRERRGVDEYYDARWDPTFRIGRAAPFVELEHWQIRTLASSGGDKLEVFNGSTYEDWLSIGKVHGRTDDYFLIPRNGRIYFPRSFPVIKRYSFGVRVTYRYGEVDVTGDVHELAVKMTAIRILLTDHRILIAAGGPQGPQTPNVSETIRALQEQVDQKLSDKSWIRSPRRRWRLSGGPHGR